MKTLPGQCTRGSHGSARGGLGQTGHRAAPDKQAVPTVRWPWLPGYEITNEQSHYHLRLRASHQVRGFCSRDDPSGSSQLALPNSWACIWDPGQESTLFCSVAYKLTTMNLWPENQDQRRQHPGKVEGAEPSASCCPGGRPPRATCAHGARKHTGHHNRKPSIYLTGGFVFCAALVFI